jgi:outer membrane protein TolC
MNPETPASWKFMFRVVGVVMIITTLCSCISSRSLTESDEAPPPATPTEVASPQVSTARDDQTRITDESRLLTIEECIRYAYAHNRSIARAQWRARGAKADVDYASSALLPSIHADGAFSTRNNDPGVSFNGVKFVTGDRTVATGDLIASIPLLSATDGKRTTARHALSAAQANSNQALSDIAAAVTATIFDLLESRERIDLIASSVHSLAEQATIAEDRQKAGLVLSSDSLADQVRVAEREQDQLHATNDAEIIQSQLNRLLGLPIQHHLLFVPLSAVALPQMDEATLLQQALLHRQDLISMRERLAQSLSQIHEAKAAYVPQASLFGGLYASTDSLILNREYFGAGLSVSIPLLDNGQTAARIDAAKADAGEKEEATQELIDQIREEVHQAVLAAKETSARLPVSLQADQLARQRLAQVEDQYRHGLSDMTTVLDAESEQVRTRLDAMHAQMDMHRVLQQLYRVTQTPTVTIQPPR